MRHLAEHDPVIDWQLCWTCHQALSAAFASTAEMDLGPDDAGKLVTVIRGEAERWILEDGKIS